MKHDDFSERRAKAGEPIEIRRYKYGTSIKNDGWLDCRYVGIMSNGTVVVERDLSTGSAPFLELEKYETWDVRMKYPLRGTES